MSAACASCGAAVNVPTSAAWPERCPRCGAAPLSTGSGAPLGSGMGGGDSGSSAVPRPSSAAKVDRFVHHDGEWYRLEAVVCDWCGHPTLPSSDGLCAACAELNEADVPREVQRGT